MRKNQLLLKNMLAKLYKNAFLQFGFVLICALCFRITFLNLIEFKGDEAINLYLAALPKFQHFFPPGSTISSFGILNPPLINYLLFPITIFTADPRLASAYIGILNALAIALFYIYLRNYFSTISSLFTSLMLAFSPWSIIYSRKIWAQDFLLPLMVPLLFSISMILNKRLKYWIAYSFLALLLVQLHQPSLLFVIPLTIFLLLQKPKISKKYILFGILLGILPLIPYGWYEIMNNCPDCAMLMQAGQNTTPTLSPIHFFRPFQVINNGNFLFLLGEDNTLFTKNYPLQTKMSILYIAELIFLPSGGLYLFKKIKDLRFVLFTLIAVPIIYFLLKIVHHMHYYTILIPFIFIFLCAGIQKGFESRYRFIKFGTVVACIAIIIGSILYVKAFFEFLKIQRYLKGDYGSTYFENARTAKEYFGDAQFYPDYDEMFLAYYVSKDFIYADSPGSKMFFNLEKTKKNYSNLELQLEKNPVDSRIVNELIFYYSNPEFDKSIVQDLDEKRMLGKGFEDLAHNINKYYRERRKE